MLAVLAMLAVYAWHRYGAGIAGVAAACGVGILLLRRHEYKRWMSPIGPWTRRVVVARACKCSVPRHFSVLAQIAIRHCNLNGTI